jgi:hypothetical protein
MDAIRAKGNLTPLALKEVIVRLTLWKWLVAARANEYSFLLFEWLSLNRV